MKRGPKKYRQVTPQAPCPVCGNTKWCMIEPHGKIWCNKSRGPVDGSSIVERAESHTVYRALTGKVKLPEARTTTKQVHLRLGGGEALDLIQGERGELQRLLRQGRSRTD